MNIIGVDLSLTSTGMAEIYENGDACCWSIASSGRRNDSLNERAHRLRMLAGRVVEGIADDDHVVLEAPSYGSVGASSWDRAGLWWQIVARLTRRDIAISTVAPMTRARWATGSGRSDKAAVAAVMSRLFPNVQIANSDEADALALAHIAAVRFDYDVARRAHQTAELFAKVHWADAA